MPFPVLDYRAPGAQPGRVSYTALEKVVCLTLGVVAPIICFAVAFERYPGEPVFQMDRWDRYIIFVPDGRVGFPFYPLLIYSMLALGVFIIHPESSRRLAVRLGLYTGVILSLQYSLIQALALGDGWFIVPFGIGLASNFILLAVVMVLKRLPQRPLGISALILASVGGAIAVSIFRGNSRWFQNWRYVNGMGVIVAMFAPAWCAGVYISTAMFARRLEAESHEKPSGGIPRAASWAGWFIAYAGAWQWSIANAIVKYNSLPSDSGCYIATAAARGHRRFVGSTATVAGDGKVYTTNDQLQRLKHAEIALSITSPRLHRLIRRIYDFVGPPAAGVIARRPLLADIAYVSLKPFEWVSFALLITLVPQLRRKD